MINSTSIGIDSSNPNLSLQMPSSAGVKVNVSYKIGLKREQLVEAIQQVANPQVIFWYMGAYGLREQGVKYYRKDLSKILQTSNATCQLYDLTAWAPFAPKDLNSSVKSFNQNADLINQFAIPRIQCLKSCDFFNWITDLQSEGKMKVLKQILQRPFIYSASEGYSETQRTIGDIFKRQCPLLEELYQQNTSKCYSALQYVEGIYLIQTIVRQVVQSSERQEINLIFALPNDEYRYYSDASNSFEQDVKALLQQENDVNLKNKTVNVMFYTFQFGKNPSNRPYNAGKDNIQVLTNISEIVQLPEKLKKDLISKKSTNEEASE